MRSVGDQREAARKDAADHLRQHEAASQDQRDCQRAAVGAAPTVVMVSGHVRSSNRLFRRRSTRIDLVPVGHVLKNAAREPAIGRRQYDERK